MFDPVQSAALREPGPDGPACANVVALTTLQREALVSLLCGSARHLPGRRGRWIVSSLGTSWAIEPATIKTLAARGLITLGGGTRSARPLVRPQRGPPTGRSNRHHATAERVTVPRRPIEIEPRLLSREAAAAYVGLGATKFDDLVKQKRMPQALRIDGRVLWDRRALDHVIDRIAEGTSVNPWDAVA